MSIRRGLLNGLYLKSTIKSIVNYNALVVPPEISRQMVLQLMMVNRLLQIPIVDEQQKLIGLHLWDEIDSSHTPKFNGDYVGGKVTLTAHTENCPKPMVLVAGKPILEHIIERAQLEGFNHIVL